MPSTIGAEVLTFLSMIIARKNYQLTESIVLMRAGAENSLSLRKRRNLTVITNGRSVLPTSWDAEGER